MVEYIKVLTAGGVVLLRDYAVNDHAMIRFKNGCKLADRFYVRQDNTRAYYFTTGKIQLKLAQISILLIFLILVFLMMQIDFWIYKPK